MHLQGCFAYLGYGAGAYPESERAAKETLALPIYPELSEAQLRYVVESIRELVAGRPSTEGSSNLSASEVVGLPTRR